MPRAGWAVLALLLAAPVHAGAVLQRIAERGVLHVCSNIENRPFAYLSPSGQTQGFNIDLAEDVRARLSADLGQPLRPNNIIATSGANRVPFLERGKCDVIITGYTVTPERQRLVRFITPNFYSSGAVLLADRTHPVASWESLHGKTVCSSHGSTYNQAVAERYGVRILAFAGLTESAQALRDQRCVGQVMDEAVARLRLLNQREWAQFEIKLPTILEAPWSMAIAHGDEEFRQLLEGYAQAWRDEGLIETLETRYGLPHKPVLEVVATAEAGDPAALPLPLQRIAAQMQAFYADTGWNFVVFHDGWSARQFIHGIGMTVKLALVCMLASCLIGLSGTLAARGGRGLRWLVQGYVELLRNTPGLAQLYFLYFGIGSLLRGGVPGAAMPWYAEAFTLAAACISLHYGAFAVEIFRAGFKAVPAATHEAALALGYGRWGRMRHVVLPIALRASVPALGNNLVQVIKGTSIAYAVAVPEVLYSAQEIWNERSNVVEMMLLVLLTYLTLMALLALALAWLERRLRLPGATL